MPLEDFLDMAARLGYEGVDLREPQIHAYVEGERVGEVKKMLRERKLSAAYISLPETDELMDVGVVDVWLSAAVVLGTNLVRFSGNDLTTARKVAEHARPKKLRIAPQLHTNTLFDTPQGARGSLNIIGMDNFGVILEPANLVLRGLGYDEETIRPLGGRIFAANLQNVREVPAGEGQFSYYGREYARVTWGDPGGIDFGAFVKALKGVGFDGWLNVLEPKPAHGGIEEKALHCREFLRAITG